MSKDKTISNGVIHNAIAPGTQITGSITAENDFRIDGNIDGDIVCQGKVIVGRQGFVKGKIVCVNAEIVGQVDGRIQVSEILTLKATAIVQGEIKISTLIVEPNAQFNGSCEMFNKEAQAE